MVARWAEANGNQIRDAYACLREIASRLLRRERDAHTLQRTSLVHEALLRLFRVPREPLSTEEFLKLAAHQMREILIDYSRHHRAKKRGRDFEHVSFYEIGPSVEADLDRLLILDQVLDRLGRIDPRALSVVELKFFGGYTNAETAKILGVSRWHGGSGLAVRSILAIWSLEGKISQFSAITVRMSPDDLARVKTAHLAALRLPAESRKAYLEQLFPADLELRGEVEKLLAWHDDAGGFLSRSVASRILEPGLPDIRKQRIGPYEVVRELGRGDSATVYLARRAELFEKFVASLGDIAVLAMAQAVVRFPANTGAITGARAVLNLAGTYTGGTFASNVRVTLP